MVPFAPTDKISVSIRIGIRIFTFWPLSSHHQFLTCHVLRFAKSYCCDFIANDEWLPIYLTPIHWIIRFGANWAMKRGSLITSCNQSQNKFQSL